MNERGFTLLEVLIAFAIAALALSALFSGTVAGLSATAASARYQEALSLARSRLAAIGRGEAIAQMEKSGTEGDGFSWTLRIRKIGTRALTLSDTDQANDVAPADALLFDVVTTESWRDGERTRQVTLATRRIDVQARNAGP